MPQDSDRFGGRLSPDIPPPPHDYSWYEVWIQVLTRPSVQSYRDLLRDPDALPNRAYLWVFVSSTAFYAVYMIAKSAHPAHDNMISSSIFFFYLPFAGPVTILILVGATRMHQLVAQWLGGQGPYSQVVYMYGALIASIQMLDITTAFIPYPFNAGIAGLLGVYALVIATIAVEAIYGFGWIRAAITALCWAPLIALFVVVVTTIDADIFEQIADFFEPYIL